MNAEIKPIKTAAEAALAKEFAACKAALPGGGKLAATREAAFQHFEQAGLPHRRLENWKYTDLRALMREAKPLAPPPDAHAKAAAKTAGVLLAGIAPHRILFVDGAFVPELSGLDALDAGVTVASLATALADGAQGGIAESFAVSTGDNSALALNTAFMSDGAIIRVAKNAVVPHPIELVFAHSAAAAATFTRSQVIVETGAEVMLVENHEGPDGVDYQVNTALDLRIGDGAKVDHLKVVNEGDQALHVSTLLATVGEGANVHDFTFTIGGAVVRNQLLVECAGKNSRLHLGGANLLRRRQHADTTLVLDHAVSGCVSREVFKSVLDDESRGVFQGKIVVRQHAQKTDARMLSNALLLSDEAEADNKPELEIFADDVQCGHGATAGALDDNLKFYLMARGIPEKEAEALLIQAFIGAAVESIGHEGVRNALMFATRKWLGQRE